MAQSESLIFMGCLNPREEDAPIKDYAVFLSPIEILNSEQNNFYFRKVKNCVISCN